MDPKLIESLKLIADSVDNGYTALFTYATKEKLDRNERNELSSLIRSIAEDPNHIGHFQQPSDRLQERKH